MPAFTCDTSQKTYGQRRYELEHADGVPWANLAEREREKWEGHPLTLLMMLHDNVQSNRTRLQMQHEKHACAQERNDGEAYEHGTRRAGEWLRESLAEQRGAEAMVAVIATWLRLNADALPSDFAPECIADILGGMVADEQHK